MPSRRRLPISLGWPRALTTPLGPLLYVQSGVLCPETPGLQGSLLTHLPASPLPRSLQPPCSHHSKPVFLKHRSLLTVQTQGWNRKSGIVVEEGRVLKTKPALHGPSVILAPLPSSTFAPLIFFLLHAPHLQKQLLTQL